jgi:hypothetical protein
LKLRPVRYVRDFAGIAAPARRALFDAGIENLAQIVNWREADIAKLRGIGPSALGQLRLKLREKKLSFAEYKSESRRPNRRGV